MRSSLPLLAALLAVTPAFGQFGHAELSGTVTSRDGVALSGAAVTMRAVETALVRSATTTPHGTYLLTGLEPGTYLVTFQFDGFAELKFTGVELRLGQTTELSAAMEVASLTETITVTAKPHVIDLRSRHVGDTLTEREFRDLPTQNRSFVLFAGLVPGVVPSPQTDSISGDALYINGQHQANNSFRLDGARNDDDVVGSLAGAQVRTPIEAIQEFQILTSQYDAELGGATGGVLNAITKSGTNGIKGSVFAFLQQAQWNEQDTFGERADLPRPDSQLGLAGFTVGGPIRRDRLHYFLSFEGIDDREGHVRFFTSRPDLSYSTTEANEVRNFLGRVDFQPTAGQHASARYLTEDAPQRNLIVGAQTTLEGAGAERDTDASWIAGLESVLAERAVNSLRVSYTHERILNAPSPFGVWASDFDRLRSLGPLLDRPSVDEGPRVLGIDQESESIDLADTLSVLRPQGEITHEIGAGVQWARRAIDNRPFGGANGSFEFNTDRSFDANDLTTYPFAFTGRVHGPARAIASGSELLALFVQDAIDLRANLTLSAGLRWELDDAVSDGDNLAPRLSMAWSPGTTAPTVVRGGFGRFYDHMRLGGPWSQFQIDAVQATEGLLFRVPNAGANRQFFFDLARANGITSLVALRDLVVHILEGEASAGFNSSPTVDHGDRVQPYVDTTTLGAEREFAQGWAAGVDLVYTESRDTLLLVDLNPFSRAQGGRPDISILDGEVAPMGSISTLMNAGTNTYQAVQLSLRKRRSDRLGGRVAYTYADSEGNYGNAAPLGGFNTAYFQTRSETGYNFDTGQVIGEPLRLNLEGPGSADQPVGWHRRHNFVIAGVWSVPRTSWREGEGLSLSWLYRYMSGDRFTVFTTDLLDNGNRAPAAAGTYDATVPSDVGLNDVSFSGTMFGAENPDFSRLDISLRYAIPMRHRRVQLTLLGDVFNATNRANFVNAGGAIAGTAGFLTPSATFSPREFQLGARLSF